MMYSFTMYECIGLNLLILFEYYVNHLKALGTAIDSFERCCMNKV